MLKVLADNQDPTGNTILVATDIGVFRSTNGGSTWAAFNLGLLPAVPVFDIEQNNKGTIFIGTHGRGVYQLVTAPPPVSASLVVTPRSLAFPNEVVRGTSGATSKPKKVTLYNPHTKSQNDSIVLQTIVPSGDFAVDANSSTCTSGMTLATGARCVVALAFTPAASGSRNGALDVSDNASNSPQSVALKGAGVQGALTYLPHTLLFHGVALGNDRSLTVNLLNKNAVPMSITNITGSDVHFNPTQNCLGTLNAGASCPVTVTFAPDSVSRFAATLNIADDARGSPQAVKLVGVGKAGP